MTQFTLGSRLALAALGMALAAGGNAAAADGRAAVLKAVVDCRALTDATARLACYDSAIATLDEAEAKGDLVVMDREQTRQARREAFGFSLPSLALFSRGEAPETLQREAFKVARAWEGGDGKWWIELDTGAIWRQTDNEGLGRRPKAGSTAEIRSASMGGFFMNLDGQRAIRVKREK